MWAIPGGLATPTSRFRSRSDSKLSRPIDFTSRSTLLPIETIMLLLNLTAVFTTSYFFSRSTTIIGRYYIIFYWMALFRCVDLSFVKKRKENLIREKNKVPVEGCFPDNSDDSFFVPSGQWQRGAVKISASQRPGIFMETQTPPLANEKPRVVNCRPTRSKADKILFHLIKCGPFFRTLLSAGSGLQGERSWGDCTAL